MTELDRREPTEWGVARRPTLDRSEGAGAEALDLSVSHLHKKFVGARVGSVKAIDDMSLDVKSGEMLVLLGPSGCGKTTLLRCVAGLEQPDSGRITIKSTLVFSDERRIDVPTQRRALSMMFQSYALWPHMTAFENVAYPLRAGHVPEPLIKERVMRILEVAGVGALAREHPGAMSGGQQQRVALARALVAESPLILFDEPLSNVDAKVREQLRREITLMQNTFRFAGLYVTHDQKEALALAHRIAVIDCGRVVQIGTPEDLYSEPSTAYVAELLGPVNQFDGIVKQQYGPTVVVESDVGLVRGRLSRGSSGVNVGQRVGVVFRPEDARLVGPGSEPARETDNEWSGEWRGHVFAGSHTEESVQIRTAVVRAWGARRDAVPNALVVVRVPDAAVRIVAGAPRDADPTAGETSEKR